MLVSLALSASALGAAARALAQDASATANPTPPAPKKTPDSAANADNANDQAQAAYARAMSAYAQGDKQAALDAMLESYRLSDRPELLYNLARLERELQKCQAARADFLSYLQRVPSGSYRSNAEQASQELEVECKNDKTAKQSALAAPAAATTARPSAPSPSGSQASAPYWSTPRLLGWSAISAGVLAGGGALYFTFAARAARDDVARSVSVQEMGGPHWDQARQEDQHRDLAVARVLAIASGALVTGGALELIFGPQPSRDRAHASVAVTPGLLEARYCRSF